MDVMERSGSIKKGKASRYTGVFRAGLKWKAQLQHKNRSIYLGCYSTEEEAASVYQAEKARIMAIEGQQKAPVPTTLPIPTPTMTSATMMKYTNPLSVPVTSSYRSTSAPPFRSSASMSDTTTSASHTVASDNAGDDRVLLMVEVSRVTELMEKIRCGDLMSDESTQEHPSFILR